MRMSAVEQQLPPIRMTRAEFLAWSQVTAGRWELVDGEPQAMAPASLRHGAIQSELGRLLGNHLEKAASSCVVFTDPGIVPRLRSDANMRIPDLAVTCSSDRDGYDLSEPVLIVEILSPTNVRATWANVWAYTTIPSVQEMLVLASTAVSAELLRRRPDGSWPQEPEQLGADATLNLDSVGLTLPLRDAYRTTRLVR